MNLTISNSKISLTEGVNFSLARWLDIAGYTKENTNEIILYETSHPLTKILTTRAVLEDEKMKHLLTKEVVKITKSYDVYGVERFSILIKN